jgi:hypothetical protein
MTRCSRYGITARSAAPDQHQRQRDQRPDWSTAGPATIVVSGR